MGSYIYRDEVMKDTAVEVLGEVVLSLVAVAKCTAANKETMYAKLRHIMHDEVLPGG